uniref:Uncharacterized protein n=1 Tax=Anguilla anguilla TaxID=7936 RepID=A0A0E9T4Y9_ANGAN
MCSAQNIFCLYVHPSFQYLLNRKGFWGFAIRLIPLVCGIAA